MFICSLFRLMPAYKKYHRSVVIVVAINASVFTILLSSPLM